MKSVTRVLSGLLHVIVVSLAFALPAGCSRAESPEPQPKPADIVPLDEVKVGMKGYGLTVFQGTKIEPFAIEVVSIARDFAPKRGVIWIRCTDERMQSTGPVSGMSGSPIYLWPEGTQEGQPGQGGKLIGAFAYGYSFGKDCYAGVQPIELMRDTAERAVPSINSVKRTAARKDLSQLVPMMGNWLRQAKAQGLSDRETWRLALASKVFAAGDTSILATGDAAMSVTSPLGEQIEPMVVPLQVGLPTVGPWLEPLLASTRLKPVYASNTGGLTQLPPGVDASQIKIEPGSVLSIPLASGDMDLSAAGTVTDVLPNGRVLAFGHAMSATGETALPYATGYVHYIQPSLRTSFKMTSSAVMQPGALVRDESAAVVTSPGGTYTAATMRVAVQLPGQAEQEYNYQIVHDDQYTGILSVIVALNSLYAQQSLPTENTVTMRGELKFEGNRTVKIDRLLPQFSFFALLEQLWMPVAAMSQNPFERVLIKSIDLHMSVEPVTHMASYSTAVLEREEVAPGGTARVFTKVKPRGKPEQEVLFELPIPQDLPVGEYQLFLSDGWGYLDRVMDSQPHLMHIESVDDLLKVIRLFGDLKDNVVYVMLRRPDSGLAIGRNELPNLPSSHRTILGSELNTLTTPYAQWVINRKTLDYALYGQFVFTINVQRESSAQPGHRHTTNTTP